MTLDIDRDLEAAADGALHHILDTVIRPTIRRTSRNAPSTARRRRSRNGTSDRRTGTRVPVHQHPGRGAGVDTRRDVAADSTANHGVADRSPDDFSAPRPAAKRAWLLSALQGSVAAAGPKTT